VNLIKFKKFNFRVLFTISIVEFVLGLKIFPYGLFKFRSNAGQRFTEVLVLNLPYFVTWKNLNKYKFYGGVNGGRRATRWLEFTVYSWLVTFVGRGKFKFIKQVYTRPDPTPKRYLEALQQQIALGPATHYYNEARQAATPDSSGNTKPIPRPVYMIPRHLVTKHELALKRVNALHSERGLPLVDSTRYVPPAEEIKTPPKSKPKRKATKKTKTKK